MEDPVTAEVPSEPAEGFLGGVKTRKEKRKALKKLKRKQIRKEAAIREREEEEAWSNDPEEQLKIRLKEQEAAEIADRERKEFEERERLWIEAAAKRKAEEEERKKKLLEESQMEKNQQTDHANELEEGDGWDYVEEGPAEIIWQGNEIIVKKKRVKVARISADRPPDEEDDDRPTSNPLPPQSAAFASYKNGQSVTAQEVLESVAQQVPNFGTEQDKAHCPFHLKTAACRFGSRCSRVHFYPDKSCTLLIKNMYNGPGLAWEQDEGLEYTDEEVERCYEEFYEDVHTEFLKFGELVNFKVCKNGSYHLRGNLYVHYKSLDSAILAYNTMNGRYFAGKQITCEYVSVTRWKVAICGEYMKSRLKNCSHGTACNFIHCFRNPGGDYEWADWDDPPPKYWIEKMVVLFGPSDESGYGKQMELEDWERRRDTSRKETPIHSRRYWSRRSTYGKMEGHDSGSGREDSDRKRDRCSSHSVRREHSSRRRKETSFLDKHEQSEENHKSKVHGYNTKYCSYGHDSDEDSSKEKDREFLKKHQKIEEKNSFQGHERHTKKNRTIEDLSRWEKGEAFYVEQEKSVRKHKSKSRKRHGEGHRSSDHISGYTDDNRERSYSRSSEESYSRQSIDAQDRYNGRYCSDDNDSRREFSHESRSQHSKQANEKRETDQYNSEHQTSHTCYENEQIGRKGKLRTKEGSNQRFSSAESSGGWETTYRDSGWEENYDRSLCNGSGRYHRKHSTSGGNGKHLREKREHEVSNLGSDEELDMRAYKKLSRSQTSTRCSGSSKRERNQRSSHDL